MNKKGEYPDNDALASKSGVIGQKGDSKQTLVGTVMPGNVIVGGEIVEMSDEPVPASTAGVVSGSVDSSRENLHDTLINEASVETHEPGVVVHEVETKTMDMEERKAVRDRIRSEISSQKIRGFNDVVKVIGDCLPVGVRKPKICDVKNIRECIVQLDEKETPETEVIRVRLDELECRIDIEKGGVRMYVKVGLNWMRYAE